MKRFLLFIGVCYYPRRGAKDLRGSFQCFDEAYNAAVEFYNFEGDYFEDSEWPYFEGPDWAHVLDTVTGEIVEVDL